MESKKCPKCGKNMISHGTKSNRRTKICTALYKCKCGYYSNKEKEPTGANKKEVDKFEVEFRGLLARYMTEYTQKELVEQHEKGDNQLKHKLQLMQRAISNTVGSISSMCRELEQLQYIETDYNIPTAPRIRTDADEVWARNSIAREEEMQEVRDKYGGSEG